MTFNVIPAIASNIEPTLRLLVLHDASTFNFVSQIMICSAGNSGMRPPHSRLATNHNLSKPLLHEPDAPEEAPASTYNKLPALSKRGQMVGGRLAGETCNCPSTFHLMIVNSTFKSRLNFSGPTKNHLHDHTALGGAAGSYGRVALRCS